jgi:hypothetical protein
LHNDPFKAVIRQMRGWIRDNPMDCVESLAEKDPLHPRRALTDEKLARLIQAATIGPALHGMSGA